MTEQQDYTLNTFKNAHWLVYLNGLEVPVIGVNTSFKVWEFPTASIEMVPHPCLQRLGNEDRIQVAVFFLDVFKDPSDPTFRLLGEFEVTGWSYSNSPYGRSINLNCVSHLQIFAQLFFFYMSSVDDVIVGSGAAFATAAHAGSGAKVYYPSSLFISGLVPKGAAGEATEDGATEGTGDAAKTTAKKEGPSSEYGTAVERSEPVPGQEIVDENEFIRTPLEFITNIFKALTAYTSMGTNPDVTENPNRIPSSAISYMGRNFFGRWILTTKFHRRWVALPIFEDDAAREDLGCFPLVKAIGDYHLLRIMQKNVMNGVGQASAVWNLLQMVYGNMYMDIIPIPAPAAVRENKKTWNIEREFRDQDLTIPKPKLKGDVSGVAYKTNQTFEPALTSYLVKPQSVFGVPPKCNIIFPSMVKNLMFQEDYMSQPTRLYMGETLITDLLTTPEGKNTGFASVMADQLATGYPNIVKSKMKDYIQNPGENTKNFILYAEEFFKGPNTARINAPPWLFLLAQASKKEREGGGGGGLPHFGKQDQNSIKFTSIKEIFEALSAAGTVTTDTKGRKIPNIPAGALWGLSWYESRFKWDAHRLGGMFGYMQICSKGGKTAGVFRVANASKTHTPQFDWNVEFHNLIKTLKNSNLILPKTGDSTKKLSAAQEMFKYYDLNLAKYDGNGNMFKHSIIKKIVESEESRGLNIVLGYLYLQSIILITFSHYKYNKINWNDTYVGYSAYGVGKLRREKAKMPGSLATKAGWIPPDKNARAYAKGAKAAWAHFSGAKYGDAGFPTYESDMDLTDASTPEIAEQTITFGMLGSAFDLFAKYEYYRQRYSQRSATVNLVFNPYIVPGFPCVIIDEPQAAISFLGYVTGVTHVMRASADGPQMTTSVNVSFMRTLGEYFVAGVEDQKETEKKATEMVEGTGISVPTETGVSSEDLMSYAGEDSSEFPTGQSAEDIIAQGSPTLTRAQLRRYNDLMSAAGKYIGHPREPIEGVRDIFQQIDQAEELYTRLFYPGDKQYRKGKAKTRHLFHLPDFFRVVNKDDETSYIARDLLMDLPMFELQKRFAPEAFSYDAAMAYVARPSCSLHNYVRMWHRNDFKEEGKTGVVPKKLRKKGIRLIKSYPEVQAISGKNTYYYPRIYRFRSGPVPEGLRSVKSDKIKATETFKKYVQQITNVDLDGGTGANKKYGRFLGQANRDSKCLHPETRFDWDTLLEQYLKFLKSRLSIGKK